MKNAIFIGSGKGREVWLNECLKSVKGVKYKVEVVVDLTFFELGTIKYAYDKGYDEFFYMHDSCVVKDKKIFDFMFNDLKGSSVCVSNHPGLFGMYIGKYTRKDLERVKLFIPKDKMDAVENEVTWTNEYASKADSVIMMNPPLRDGYNFVNKNGRLNMKLENDYMIKYKATWNRSMIKV